MKVPIGWLKEYVPTDLSASEIGDKLTYIGHMQDGPIQRIGNEAVLDLEVRQNRPDCLSIIGLSRELAVITGHKVVYPMTLQLPEVTKDSLVTIKDSTLCYRFNTVLITNIDMVETPIYIVDRLRSFGIESVNAIVDITNFVMIEYGQPLHAFDSDKLNGTLTVRLAK